MRKTAKLSRRQKVVLGILDQLDYVPTLRELAELAGIGSHNGAKIHLDRLTEKGYLIRMSESGARNFRVVPPWWKVPACVAAVARHGHRFEILESVDAVIDMMINPSAHGDLWDDFCQTSPEQVEQLRQVACWRAE